MEENREQVFQEESQGEAGTMKNGQKGKVFTQEEVNGLIQGRLSRMREKITREVQEEQNQKIAELEARERTQQKRNAERVCRSD